MKFSFLLCLITSALIFGYSNYSDTSPSREKVVWSSFSVAKNRAQNHVYKDMNITLYCKCYSKGRRYSGGKIRWNSCDYRVRTSETRAKRLEWEHVVPASYYGKVLPCRTEWHSDCDEPVRECCEEVDDKFREAYVDLHNLVPAVGEINNDRSDHPRNRRRRGACLRILWFWGGGRTKTSRARRRNKGWYCRNMVLYDWRIWGTDLGRKIDHV